MKKIKFKCWIEDNNEKFYGPGPNELLKRIQSEGSLSKAAEQMHMSYKKAWEMVQRLNHHSDEPLVILKKGGQHGGGAEVTPHAIMIMDQYESLQKKLAELIDEEENLLKILK
ncbi:LysR family transcriptional regulator [Gramella sp. MAR_2010_147]|uniref:winged helix-turn-helix domain-containing protein n=1 Tax=Gramella sp. MAR_2010_147 TaxID=1250205 RepID=UPI000879601E|nr:LysR family transcriptional regulator [Gramella sp. MAR_2010_147]SDR71076.1 molybdate transport system regulatory protein [Gramella sp. MAR_2010_147]